MKKLKSHPFGTVMELLYSLNSVIVKTVVLWKVRHFSAKVEKYIYNIYGGGGDL
jgi:hypothetical protein